MELIQDYIKNVKNPTIHNPEMWKLKSYGQNKSWCCTNFCVNYLLCMPNCGHQLTYIYLGKPDHRFCQFCFSQKLATGSLNICDYDCIDSAVGVCQRETPKLMFRDIYCKRCEFHYLNKVEKDKHVEPLSNQLCNR